MSSSLPTSSLAGSLNLRITVPSARAGVLGIEGLGASSDSFSRTLQNQMNTAGQGSGASSANASPAAEPRREPEPTRTSEQARQPEREPARETQQSSENRPAEQQSGADGGKAADRPAEDARGTGASKGNREDAAGQQAAQTEGTATDARADAAGSEAEAGARNGPGVIIGAATEGLEAVDAAAASLLAAEAAAGAAASSPTDPAALAGLPAAIAALLSGRREPAAGGNATEGAALVSDDKGRALQNSGLMPKTDTSAEGGGRGVATPAFLLQGRELAAALVSNRGAAGQAAQALQGEAGNLATPQPGQAAHAHAAAQLLRHAPPPQPAPPQLPVHTPAGQQAWAEDVGNQVRWMLGRAESKAELVLTPPNLGKLEVSINLNGDQTTAQFIASSQAARDALERAMPQLREVLQQAGIMLGDANVSTSQQGAGGDGQEGGSGPGTNGGTARAEGSADAAASGSVWLRQQQGMVDTFA
ncbi:MAG: flagellar hook-length control protein FliK [Thauera sp.]